MSRDWFWNVTVYCSSAATNSACSFKPCWRIRSTTTDELQAGTTSVVDAGSHLTQEISAPWPNLFPHLHCSWNTQQRSWTSQTARRRCISLRTSSPPSSLSCHSRHQARPCILYWLALRHIKPMILIDDHTCDWHAASHDAQTRAMFEAVAVTQSVGLR